MNMMIAHLSRIRWIGPALVFVVLCSGQPAGAQEVDCLKCHAGIIKEKVVHPAVQMGCPTCHGNITDALKVPHKKTGTAPKGLTSDQPDLCYGCHDKTIFTKKHVHPAIGMGCTACHNPHASKNERLLVDTVPDLCFTCHDKAEFSHKNVHPPVAGGMCLSCHNPHSSDFTGLLLKKPPEVCLDCHDDVAKQPHAMSGFGKRGHPLGLEKKDKQGKVIKPARDPKRPGKPFFCASCHNPHSSDYIHLFRYKADTPMQLCSNCHRY